MLVADALGGRLRRDPMPDDPTRRRGRPRLDPTGRPVAAVQVKLTAADYDAIYKVATPGGVTIGGN